MTFSVSEFKSKLQKHGGVARKNLFVVEIYDNGLTSQPIIEPGDLRFFCKTTSLPGINVVVQDYFPNGFGVRQSIPTAASTGDVNLVFMLDSDHKVLSFFHRWMQKVVNYDVSSGIFSAVDDQLPFEFGYKNEYTTTISIKFYSTDSEQYYEYILYDAFPTQVSPVDVSWDDNDSYATMTVNIAFSNMKVTAARIGTPSSRNSRGQGLLEFLNSVGRTAQLINQNSKLPKTIQDSINSFTRVKDAFNKITSIF
jgi:hypothetical protein